jgi:small subunit ribosomal protein S6
MREYETIYVLKPDLPADQVKVLRDKVQDIIERAEGKVLHHVDWGKRRLAYKVEKFQQAQYLYLQYLDKGLSIAEIERILKNDDKVIKFLTVQVEEKVNVEDRLASAGEAPTAPEELVREEPSHDRYPPRERYGDRDRRPEAAPADDMTGEESPE